MSKDHEFNLQKIACRVLNKPASGDFR